MPGGIGFTLQAPQFLPIKFHYDYIIPVPVLVAKSEAKEEGDGGKRGFIGKMKGLVSGKDKDGKLRVVYMPRRDYLKYFAKDDDWQVCRHRAAEDLYG
jgi:hypothetical protein